jgi:hypothetical protein
MTYAPTQPPGIVKFPTSPLWIATLRIRVDVLADRFGFKIEEWQEDGLGSARGFVCRLSSGRLVLIYELAHQVNVLGHPGPNVEMDTSDIARDGIDAPLREVLDAFGLTSADVEGKQNDKEAQARAVYLVECYWQAKHGGA